MDGRRMQVSVLGAALVALLVAGCASQAETEEMGAASPSPSATPTPSPTPTPEPESTTFTTQNGTASFALPDGWSVEDTSYDAGTLPWGTRWSNVIAVLDAEGDVRASYSDGYLDDVGASAEQTLVDDVPMPSDLSVASWTTHYPAYEDAPEEWVATAAVVRSDVVRDGGPFGYSVQLAPGERLHSFSADPSSVPECATIADEAAAVACLEAPGTLEAIGVLATLELHDVPADAMPPEYETEAAAEPWVEFASPGGAIAFSHPASWTVQTPHADATGQFVSLITPDGLIALDVGTGAWDGAAPVESCDASLPPIEVVSSEPIAPLAGSLVGAGVHELELVTFHLPDVDFYGVAILEVRHLDAGCLVNGSWVTGGSIRATTPYATDAPGLLYDRYAAPAELVGSTEHAVVLDVLRSLEIRRFAA